MLSLAASVAQLGAANGQPFVKIAETMGASALLPMLKGKIAETIGASALLPMLKGLTDSPGEVLHMQPFPTAVWSETSDPVDNLIENLIAHCRQHKVTNSRTLQRLWQEKVYDRVQFPQVVESIKSLDKALPSRLDDSTEKALLRMVADTDANLRTSENALDKDALEHVANFRRKMKAVQNEVKTWLKTYKMHNRRTLQIITGLAWAAACRVWSLSSEMTRHRRNLMEVENGDSYLRKFNRVIKAANASLSWQSQKLSAQFELVQAHPDCTWTKSGAGEAKTEICSFNRMVRTHQEKLLELKGTLDIANSVSSSTKLEVAIWVSLGTILLIAALFIAGFLPLMIKNCFQWSNPGAPLLDPREKKLYVALSGAAVLFILWNAWSSIIEVNQLRDYIMTELKPRLTPLMPMMEDVKDKISEMMTEMEKCMIDFSPCD